MKKIVPFGNKPKGLLALIGYVIPFIIIILLWVLDIPFLIGLLVTAICFIVISTTAKSIKQLSELKAAEIGLESVTVCINNKMEEFHYSEIEDIVLVTDKGWNKNGVMIIPNEEAIAWRLSANSNRAIKNLYKNTGAMAIIPEFSCDIPIESVYKALKENFEIYTLSCSDSDENDIKNVISDIVESVKEGIAEGETMIQEIEELLDK